MAGGDGGGNALRGVAVAVACAAGHRVDGNHQTSHAHPRHSSPTTAPQHRLAHAALQLLLHRVGPPQLRSVVAKPRCSLQFKDSDIILTRVRVALLLRRPLAGCEAQREGAVVVTSREHLKRRGGCVV